MRTPHYAMAALMLFCLAWDFGLQAQTVSQTPSRSQDSEPAVTSAGTESGIGVFQQHCVSCHGNLNVPQAPLPSAIREMSPEKIYDALTIGVMKTQGSSLTEDQKRTLATFLSGRPPGSLQQGDARDMPNHCASDPPMADPSVGPAWNGWGADIADTRFQPADAAGLTAAQVPGLKLKWAFGYPGGLSAFGQPTIVSGRVFVGTDIGYVYSLDAETGCIYWSYQTKGSVRTAITVGPVEGHGSTKYAVYFGDAHANVYAVDAQSGDSLWTTKVDENFVARITGAPKVYDGRVYVPVSSSEEFSGSSLDYSCCTSRGSVVALDANTGEIIWKTYVVGEPKPTRKNSRGVQLYGPSGGSVWNSPTVDIRRDAIYFGTGDAQSQPVPDTTDAVMAVSMKTGKVLWVYQSEAGDSYLGGCTGKTKTDNCPKVNGPDQDIGNSPILRTLDGGKRLVVFGTKDGKVIALDPDKDGTVVWKVNVAPAHRGRQSRFDSRMNGIIWGGAADEQNVYYGLQGGGIVAVKLATGNRLWYKPLAKLGEHVSNSAAGTAIPGVVFAGGNDGKLHAVSSADGHILWEYGTARKFDTVNKVPARGGGINAADPTVVNGMVFVGSGYAVTGAAWGNVLLAFSVR